MTNLLIAITAYFIDKIFGEFKFFRHPIEYIKDMIEWFEKSYYQDSFLRGVYFLLFIVISTGFVGIIIQEYLSYFSTIFTIIISSFIASMFISHKALIRFVKTILKSHNKQETLHDLLEINTNKMGESAVYKTAIENYATRLNSEVIAPLFYLLLFGIPGIIVYRAIKTSDSMIGFKIKKYELYGKATAQVNDLINYIPARITATLIMLASSQKDLFAFYENGQKAHSPNSGHIKTAMALALGVRLGTQKLYFGKGRKEITQKDLENALRLFSK